MNDAGKQASDGPQERSAQKRHAQPHQSADPHSSATPAQPDQAHHAAPNISDRFEALVEATGKIVWAWVPDGSRSDFERSQRWWEEVTGQSLAEQREGENAWLQMVHPEDRDTAYQTWMSAFEKGVNYDSRYRVQSRLGGWRHIHARGAPVVNAAGQVCEWIGTLADVTEIDVTEWKRTEEMLSWLTIESEQRRRLYETVLSNTPDFVYVFSLDHRIIYANQSLLTMWGVTWEEAIGKTFIDIGYKPWHAEMHCREIDTVRDTKQSIRGEVPFDGTYGVRIYDYIFVPVLGENGEVEAVAGTTRDVTQRRELEDALRETDRRKDEFLAMLAHELRNPLVPIRSGLDILTLEPGRHQETIELMKEQMFHIIRLVDDLLDVSRIMQNKVELRKEPVQVAQICKRSVEAVQPLLDAHHHRLEISLPAAPVWIDADSVRMVQIMGNLLNNAAKYMPPGGLVELSVAREANEAVFKVRDTGIGIDTDLLPRVFELFTQASRSLDRAQGGLGIGLTLVQRLVQLHGGSVTAASDGPGRGSLFTVRLPVSPAPSLTTGPIEEVAQATARRIVVVDDNRSAAYLISKLLTMIGQHEVSVANDGEAALSTIRQVAPEIVFLDIGLPGMDGYAVCRAIRQLPGGSELLLVALTGYGQAEDRLRSQEAGFDEHIVKPPSISQIRAVLKHPKLCAGPNS